MKTILKIFTFFLAPLILGCADEKKITQEIEKQIKLETETKSTTKVSCPKYILDNKQNNLNISVLLDLSDRIESENQIQNDSSYLASISKAFISHVKTKKLLMLEDRLKLFFNPAPSNTEINVIAKKLDIAFTKGTSKKYIEETLKMYNKLPSKLYHLAKSDAKINKGYAGSDIWRFFEQHVEDYCIDNCHRNILVILTDGYMFYNESKMDSANRSSYLTPKSLSKLKLDKPNWKEEINKRNLGFIPATKNLSDLEVLVIGIKGQNGPYAENIIEAYWKKWFVEMGIQNSNIKIKSADIPSSIEKVIFDFILNK